MSDVLSLLAILLAGSYALAVLITALYSGSFFVLIALYLRQRHRTPTAPEVPETDLLSVTLQLPVYNERHVIERLIDAVGTLDYPRDRLVIQVLDDSTDDTTDRIRRKVAEWRTRGLNIQHLRRSTREGYKAGALAYGFAQCQTDCVGLFDADFAPAPDFLRRVMPHFNADPSLALVQTRAAHFNAETNWLTRAQTLAIDQHFAIEQVARSRSQLPMSMNGTGGIWRRAVIEDAGGWTFETLTEDLDLSYRAFLRGWRFRYIVDVAVPGEVPHHLMAYKIQQARWAKGSTQCLVKHAGPLLRSNLTLLQKVMGLLHLGQYAIQPVLLLIFLFTPPMLLTGLMPYIPLGPLGMAGLAPPLILAMGQIALYRDWPRRILFLPVLTLLGMGMTLNNSRAVLEAVTRRGEHVFRRTPKFDLRRGSGSPTMLHYALPRNWTTAGEGVLAVYALAGVIIAIPKAPAMVSYLALYAVAFGALAVWGWWQTR